MSSIIHHEMPLNPSSRGARQPQDTDNLLRILQDARVWFRDQIKETPTGTLPTWVVDADEVIRKTFHKR
jgi:hypothetical protein